MHTPRTVGIASVDLRETRAKTPPRTFAGNAYPANCNFASAPQPAPPPLALPALSYTSCLRALLLPAPQRGQTAEPTLLSDQLEEELMAARKSSNGDQAQDAIELLTTDHRNVKALFKRFETLKDEDDSDDEKSEIVARICAELTIHSTIEEEIFYPAVREAIDDQDLMDEADVEHAGAKELIAQLESAEPGDDHYDAKVTVLSEYIDHHVKEEEGEMFPKAKKAIDTQEIGAELAARKAELAAEMGLDEQEADDEVAIPPAGRKTAKTPARRAR
jgi:hemerythrin superfamily protein